MKYLYLTYTTLKRRMAYKADLVIGYLLVLVTGVASKYFWQALAEAGKIAPGDVRKYISYSVMTSILGSIFASDLIMVIGEKIRKGQIASDLQKPIDFQGMSMAEGFGGMLGGLLLDLLPKFAVMKILVDICLPQSFLQGVLFILSCLLGYFILLSIDYLISLLAFRFVEVWALWVIKGTVVGFCSGLYLPLWIYPEKLTAILNLLPFKHLYYVPVNIYLSDVNIGAAASSIAIQLFWAVVLFAAGRLATAAAVKKLIVAGG